MDALTAFAIAYTKFRQSNPTPEQISAVDTRTYDVDAKEAVVQLEAFVASQSPEGSD